MIRYAVLFAMAAATAAVATPIVRVRARTTGGRAVPRFGGIAIGLAFYLPLAALVAARSPLVEPIEADAATIALAGGGLLLLLTGIADDWTGLRPRTKLAVQTLVAVGAYAAGYRIEAVTNPFGDPIALGPLGVMVTVMWIVGVVNAINLIDGLDGLAAGVSLIATAGSFLVAVDRGETWFLPIAAALGGATLGFLFYNFYPATIHMGDSGSLLLGFLLAATAIHAGHKSGTTIALLVPAVMLGLPILDTVLAVARRVRSGRPILLADRDHIHHRLLGLGWSVRRAVIVLYALCGALMCAALAVVYGSTAQIAVVIAAVVTASYLLVRALGYIRGGGSRRPAAEREGARAASANSTTAT